MRRWDREKFPNQDSNLGRLKRSGTICQHTAHETIGASLLGCPIETSIRHYFSILLLSICQLSKQCTFPPTDILHVFTMFSLEMLAQQLGNHKLFTKALVFPAQNSLFCSGNGHWPGTLTRTRTMYVEKGYRTVTSKVIQTIKSSSAVELNAME